MNISAQGRIQATATADRPGGESVVDELLADRRQEAVQIIR